MRAMRHLRLLLFQKLRRMRVIAQPLRGLVDTGRPNLSIGHRYAVEQLRRSLIPTALSSREFLTLRIFP
jgi:hypothetical protein